LLHDVFVAALTSIDQVRDPNALRGWLTGIAVRKARKCIVKRRRWRIIQFFSPMDMPEGEARTTPTEVSEALRCTYELLGKLPADERLAFALRHIDGMELTAVAAACGVSLATIKRRLARAQATFVSLASQHAVLAEWLERGELGR
jgi:RNA polymerase sigma-70 factor (ECF subfamily)